MKICLIFNHLQLQDGVCRSAIAIANRLAGYKDIELTLIPLFRADKDCYKYIDKRVAVKTVFGFYFRGFASIISKIPSSLLYKYIVGDKYDVNIAFQYGPSIRIIAEGVNDNHNSIAWMHGYDEGLVYKDYYKKIGKVVCVSQCNAQRLKKELPDVDVDYNYNPIDDESIRLQGQQTVEIPKSNDVKFVSVARMSPEKGYDTLLKCVQRLKTDGYKFSLWLVGDGPILNNLKRYAEELQVTDYVTFLGQQSNPHAYVSKADVYICSSTKEGYSTTCTEAIIQGIPVLTTNCSGGQEIISEAGCGRIFGMDEDSIYNAMKEVLENPDLINEWKEILKTTRRNFSPEIRIKRFLNIVGYKEQIDIQ